MSILDKEKPASEAGNSDSINNAITARCLPEDSHNQNQNATTQAGLAPNLKAYVMISEIGWIKLHRKMLEWEWFTDPNTCHLFVYLLLAVNYKENRWRGVQVLPGQIITGRFELTKKTGLSERAIRTSLAHLEQTGEIIVKTTKQYSIVTICKFSEYQNVENASDQRPTNDRPTTDQRPTNDRPPLKKDKKDKKEDLSVAVPAPAQQLKIVPDLPDKTPKPTPVKPGRHRHGPEGSQWFLCTDEQYAAKVKERGQGWVEFWILRFCTWAGGENPAASTKIKDHFLEVEGWEMREEQAGRTWYEPAGCYLNGDQYREAERKANAATQGLKGLVKQKVN